MIREADPLLWRRRASLGMNLEFEGKASKSQRLEIKKENTKWLEIEKQREGCRYPKR